MSKIELGKTYQTKSGLNVEILKIDVNNSDGFCVVGIVDDEDGSQSTKTWLEDGKFRSGHQSTYDLVEVKETKTVWLEIFKQPDLLRTWFTTHPSKEIALSQIDKNKSEPTYQFIALKRVVYSEGDNDE